MMIENIMYFALGLLAAGLLALIVMPAVWKRAVRLTKRRIEAATPITMAEFRADKDQLRAEFALSTRKLEINVESLRKRLAEQLSEVNQKRADLGGALQTERSEHQAIVEELEAREAELRSRVLELERESTDLAQRLRMRDRELDTRNAELATLRDPETPAIEADETLSTAEASMASAETRLNALLAETSAEPPLVEKLDLEAEADTLRAKVLAVQSSILADWDSDRADEAQLRARLSDIAARVSRVVYAADHQAPPAAATTQEESLFDRVQRFADDGEKLEMLPKAKGGKRRSSVADRLTALKEIQGR
jgi:DNA repair exonuclease SbcCD ATPase subunit